MKRRAFGSITSVETTNPVVALTYDDGPDPRHTPEILVTLARHGARATFFVVADLAETHPELARRVRSEGHEIGSHGGAHLDLTRSTRRESIAVIFGGRRRAEAVLGERVHLFRPPYGRQTIGTRLLARASRLKVVLWSNNSRDCFEGGIDRFVAAAMDGLAPGGIILLHDGFAGPDPRGSEPPESPPTFDRGELTARLLEAISARGWSVVPLSELLASGRARRQLWLSPRSSGRERRDRPIAGAARGSERVDALAEE